MDSQERVVKSRPKYVWDPGKLAWVEAPTQEPVEKETSEALSTSADAKPVQPIRAEKLENVEIVDTLTYRGVFIRLVAYALDVIVLMMVLAIVVTIIGGADSTVTRYITPALGLIYFVGFWAWRGQTPGKTLFRAKVVRANGEPIGIGRSLLRYLVFVAYFYSLAYSRGHVYIIVIIAIAIVLFIALNKKRRAPHDLVAGTVVIDTRIKSGSDIDEDEGEASKENGPRDIVQ